jgi:hypothetical protein
MNEDPPVIPANDEPGRLLTHGTLAPHFLCRHCMSTLIVIVPCGILACPHCDLPTVNIRIVS